MSHISRQVANIKIKLPIDLFQAGLRIAVQILELQGVKVTDYIYGWSVTAGAVTEFAGTKLLCGLDATAVSCSGFPGLGVAIDAAGDLLLVGDFSSIGQRKRAADLQQRLEKVLNSACMLAVRMAIAEQKGQKFELILCPETEEIKLLIMAPREPTKKTTIIVGADGIINTEYQGYQGMSCLEEAAQSAIELEAVGISTEVLDLTPNPGKAKPPEIAMEISDTDNVKER